jgi:aminoglycoside phosphotransferase (APT) family kinase protein
MAPDAALETVGAALGLPGAALTKRSLARGVTHVTELVEHDGSPVAVLRFAPPRSDLLPGLDLVGEREVLARADGLAPELLMSDLDGARLGRPGLVLRYVSGLCARTWEEIRPAAQHALEVLAALHNHAGEPAGLDGSASARLGRVRALGAAGAAPAELEETLSALDARIPSPAGSGWAHGDFRPANLVVDGARVLVVLDWEMAGPGDPARDLGIATMPAWGRWWPDEELLERYCAAGGAPVTAEALRWWRCLGHAMVVAVLSSRRAAGWEGPPPDAFVRAMTLARTEWEETR